MTGTTISSYSSTGLTLTNAGQNPVTLTTTGTIDNTDGYGIAAADGVAWTITNYGFIGAGGIGIDFSADTVGVTLTNAGTIWSLFGTADAVVFGSGDNLMVVDPGAVFNGDIDGGTGSNTLALASAAAIGTLGGFGSKYLNFNSVTVAANAYWQFDPSDTIGLGVGLTNAGTINLAGNSPFYIVGGTLTNQSTGVITGNGIASAAGIGGSIVNIGLINNRDGIDLVGTGTVTNLGTILAHATGSATGYALLARHGAVVVNGASGASTAVMRGDAGIVVFSGSDNSYNGYITNFGTIGSTGANGRAVDLGHGGTLTNGDATDTAASVLGTGVGAFVTAATVTNYGTITESESNPGDEGVSGGQQASYIYNLGSSALIEGYQGILASSGTITNGGTIASSLGPTGVAVQFTQAGDRLIIEPGAIFVGTVEAFGDVGNTLDLASAATGGTLTGLGANYLNFQSVTIAAGASWTVENSNTVGAGVVLTNGGTINQVGFANVYLAGGTLTNQATGVISGFSVDALVGFNSSIDNAGLINSYGGVRIGGTATVTNLGTIAPTGKGFNSFGVYGKLGGTVTNGVAGVSTASIQGYDDGILFVGQAAYVTNFGTVVGTQDIGINLIGDGTVTNGNSTTTAATVQGDSVGVYESSGSATNYGTISATRTGGGYGLYIYSGAAQISNLGSNALIEGFKGISVSYGTIANAGTIESTQGATGIAVQFKNPGDVFVIEPGGTAIGTVQADGLGNTLVLASATTTGTLANLPAKYVNFQSVTVAAGASWSVDNSNTVGAGVVLTNAGTINPVGFATLYLNGGTLTNQSTGTIDGGQVYGFTTAPSSIDNIGRISDAYGVKLGDGGTVTNVGTIVASSGFPAGYGVYGRHGGTVINGTTGVTTARIESYGGIRFVGGTGATYNGYVTNFGTILANGGNYAGASLAQGGTVTNGSSTNTTALIQGGRWGVYVSQGTVTNYGTISSADFGSDAAGIFMQSGAEFIDNVGSNALIRGYVGIAVSYGTITNAGTIASIYGPTGIAVSFNAGPNRMIIEPGAKFIGIVEGGAVDGGAIELAGTAAGTFSGLGTNFTNFGTVAIDPGSSWSLTGANTIAGGSTFDVGGSLGIAGNITNDASFIVDGGTIGLASYADVSPGSTFNFVALPLTNPTLILGGASASTSVSPSINNFSTFDTIDLPALPFHIGATAIVSGTTMVVVSNGATADLTVSGLANGQPYFTQADSGSGTEIVACFASGTRIRTPSGEVAVEDLRIGDSVSTLNGQARPVRWIGWRKHAVEVVARNPHLRPVRMRAHAFAAGVPARDLVVSPSHALMVDGVLIPAGALVNGVSILRDPAGAIAYFHVELDQHDILLAEGAPAESFFDLAGRDIFDNAADYVAPIGENHSTCLPRIEEGAIVHAAGRRISARAGIAVALFSPGLLRGHVERIVASDDGMARTIEGWVLDEAAPNEPVELDIITETGPRLRLSANRYRPDLDRAGLAGGRCGFSVRLPGRGPVLVQRARDGVVLPMAG